jgi:cell division protein FtsQ
MPDRHDPDPDPAALDELMRAFGDEPGDRGGAGGRETGGDVEPGGGAEPGGDPAGEPAEILIVEQEPFVAPVEPAPAPVVRIDDFSGAVEVGPPAGEPGGIEPGGIEPGGIEPGDIGTSVDPPRGAVTGVDGAPSPAVITIDDEQLPDAVYVEGNLERSGGRSIVLIEDDITGDTLAPDAEREVRRGIEPRMRERRLAVKRAIGRRRLRWLALVTLVVVVGVGTLAVLGSNLFAIRAENLTIDGARYTDPELLQEVVDDLVGTPTLLADTQAAEEALAAIPWVDEARVRVSFPHSARIEIRERQAMTTYQGPDQRYRVLDREGRVLAVLNGYPFAYLLLNGPDPVDLEPGAFAPQGYAAASELTKNLTASIRGQVASMDVTADGSRLTLFLDDGTEVRFGQARDLFNKLLRLETTLQNNPEREPGVIDVSTGEVTL